MDTLVESAMENSEWVVGGLATLLTIASSIGGSPQKSTDRGSER